MANPEYDVIVVGAGVGWRHASAARLSEDPGRSVLVLEDGHDYRTADTPAVIASIDPMEHVPYLPAAPRQQPVGLLPPGPDDPAHGRAGPRRS